MTSEEYNDRFDSWFEMNKSYLKDEFSSVANDEFMEWCREMYIEECNVSDTDDYYKYG